MLGTGGGFAPAGMGMLSELRGMLPFTISMRGGRMTLSRTKPSGSLGAGLGWAEPVLAGSCQAVPFGKVALR